MFNIKVKYGAKVYCSKDWHWDSSDKQWYDFDLWAVCGGNGKLHTETETFAISKGDCFILRPYQKYIGEHDATNPLVVVYCHFDFIDENGNILIPEEANLPPLHQKIDNFVFFQELLERLSFNIKNLNDGYKLPEIWLQAILCELYRINKSTKYSGISLEQYIKIDSICKKIDEEIGQKFNINSMAKSLGYSEDHFIRLFKKFKGNTPKEYIVKKKIDSAINYLSSSSLSIGRISEILGYYDVSFFSKQFHKVTGKCPSEYR